MDARRIAAWRMANQRLIGPAADGPAAVVGWLGAVQAQEHGPAKWSVAQRLDAVDATAMAEAFAAGQLLRLHALRPTWHYLRPQDLRWVQALTAPRVHVGNAYQYRQLELEQSFRDRVAELIVAALAGGRALTRKQLEAELAAVGVSATGNRLAYLLMHAELGGLICSGPPAGKQHTYQLVDERVPADCGPQPAGEEALAELTARYFSSHGPATVADFAWWSSLTRTQIARGLELAADRLDRISIDGLSYWFAADTGGPPPPDGAVAGETVRVHLIQVYDEYVVGYTESKHVLDGSGGTRPLPPVRDVFNHVVLADGRAVGRWRAGIVGDTLTLEISLDRPPEPTLLRELERAAGEYGDYLGLTPQLQLSPAG